MVAACREAAAMSLSAKSANYRSGLFFAAEALDMGVPHGARRW
jgi:hypothetical protein